MRIQGELCTIGDMTTQTPQGALSDADLKPCPFCDGQPAFERRGTPRQSCIVLCGNCGCRHECSDENERSGQSWNDRAADRRLTAAPSAPTAQPQAEPPCGCRIGECESKPQAQCRMAEEVAAGCDGPSDAAIVDKAMELFGNWSIRDTTLVRALGIRAPTAQPQAEPALRSALERLQWSFNLLLAGKPVRDVSETLAEVAAALATTAPTEPT